MYGGFDYSIISDGDCSINLLMFAHSCYGWKFSIYCLPFVICSWLYSEFMFPDHGKDSILALHYYFYFSILKIIETKTKLQRRKDNYRKHCIEILWRATFYVHEMGYRVGCHQYYRALHYLVSCDADLF